MSKFGNLPEVVKYTEFGKEHFALVIGSRELEHHTGANDEPMLSLVIVKPVLDPTDHKTVLNIAGTSREGDLVTIVHDVAHESHAFSAEQLDAMHKTGITVSQVYPGNSIPGGRWRGLDEVADESVPVAVLPVGAVTPENVDKPIEIDKGTGANAQPIETAAVQDTAKGEAGKEASATTVAGEKPDPTIQ